MITLNVNGSDCQVEAEQTDLLVWVLREKLGLTATKFGCGIEMCGACTVFIDNLPAHSCSTKVADIIGRKIVTKEGISDDC
ncbi:MAG: 2Fe-2S iron-sulfur cluster-binding protein [Desulforhopalus sp.]